MMLALKSGPQIVAKLGNPAGLLCRRIWYSVGKSGVLGITEYRQGRPLPMYLRLTTFTKTLPKWHFTYIFLLFLFRSGAPPMTLLTAGALTDPRLHAAASNVCTTDARLGGVGQLPPPPPTKILATPVVYIIKCEYKYFYFKKYKPSCSHCNFSYDGQNYTYFFPNTMRCFRNSKMLNIPFLNIIILLWLQNVTFNFV